MNEDLSPNSTLSHYRVLEKLGAGGMGEVYLAQDTKLDRKLALKILPADVAADRGRMSRFVQEAKAASALNHPNIITIYEIDQADGIHFIATEFIDGETLRQRMKNGPMKQDDVLDVTAQIASALAAAHVAGIVHRDIKPENIMLRRDDIVKVLDFGLAKLTEQPVGISVDPEAPTRGLINTEPGVVMGTAVYMSPEQVRGLNLDARSDIFSLGIVLYEMVAGRLPFEGSSASEVMALILNNQDPQPMARYSREVPAELERIVSKALGKNRDERYQTIKDMLLDLKSLRQELEFERKLERSLPSTPPTTKRVADASERGEGQTVMEPATRPTVSERGRTSPTKLNRRSTVVAGVALLVIASAAGAYFYFFRAHGGAINSIAVMPFQNKNSDADTDYLADGLAESLIYRLSQLPNLKVSPTSSVIRYKGKDTDIAQIAKELEVDAVMSGRVSQRGDDLTISVEVVEARTKKIIWAEQYDRKMADLLATQREIATTIAQKLELKLSGNAAKGITKKYTDNNDAYQLYLRGRYSVGTRTKDEMLRAIDYFQQAIKLDPKFALAYARLAETYVSMPAFPYLSPKESFPQAKAAAQKALEIDPTLPEAHTFLAYSLIVYDFNWVEGERLFKRAIELDPNNSAAHFRYGQIYLIPTGRFDEGIAEIKRGLELEPLDITMRGNLAAAYFFSGQNDKALDEAKIIYDLEPGYVLWRLYLSQAYIEKGMYAEAVAINEQWLESAPVNQWALRNAGFAYAKAGRRDKAEEMISRLRETAKTQYIATSRIACIYGALGDKDRAFDELNKAFAARDWELYRLNVDPYWRPLRDDPRFKEMVKRLNLPE